MKILKYLMLFAFLLTAISAYSTYIIDDRLIFTTDIAAKDSVGFICIARDGAIDTLLGIDTLGNVTLIADVFITNDYLVPSNKYAFMHSTTSAGLYFNAVTGGYEFLNIAGTPIYYIGLTGPVTQETYVIRKFVSLTGGADNVATNIFTIITTDEAGATDGGMYSVKVHLTAGEATAAAGAVNTASVSLVAHWTRIMASAGTGANSAILEISESASANEGTGVITAVTLTVAETSEFVQQVQLQVNTSGGTFDGFALVELVYSDFTTPPAIQ